MLEPATLEPKIFADTLLETSRAHQARRGWTTLTSFGVQMVALGFLLLIPILTSVSTPGARTVSTPISLGRFSPEVAPQPHGARMTSDPVVPFLGRIMAPGHLPHFIRNRGDDSGTAPGGNPYPIGDSGGSPMPLPFPGGFRALMPTVAPAPPNVRPFRTSTMLQGSLIHRVDPLYPPMARAARIQGAVVLAAVIARDGTIKNLQLISGHPLLVEAAMEAVRQWRYKPYILNGEAIEVETQITANFVLGGS
jgi:periplasmic protein TonB